MRNLLMEPDGSKTSLSRVIILGGFGIVLLMWIATMIVIFASQHTWDRFSGALDWGAKFFAVTVIPYFGNVIGAGIGKIGKQTDCPPEDK